MDMFLNRQNSEEIVNANEPYNYNRMRIDTHLLQLKYRFLQSSIIGNSVLGKSIPAIRIGRGARHVLYHGGIHANEWITSLLLMKFIENFCIAYEQNRTLYGYNARELFNNISLYIVPMVNPDGIDLVTGNILPGSEILDNYRYIASNFPNIPFPNGWKANFNGVDLNLQFPANWEEARRIKFSQGYTKPAPRDYVGEGPLTEPEALAIYNFTLEHDIKLTLSYHTQGKVIFWQYLDYNPTNAYEIAQKFAQVSGYTIEEVPYDSSFAGYKDWFIMQFNKPGYTIEAGTGENPLPLSQFEEIYKDNEGILIYGMALK